MKSPDEPVSIFLVDDDKMFVESLKHKLSGEFKQDVKLTAFYNGEECLNKLDDNPDIVVLDYYLDDAKPQAMNGIEVLKKIKSTLEDTAVIMLSAQDKMVIAADSIKYGAYDYVTKSESAFIKVGNSIRNILSAVKRSRADKLYERLNYVMGAVILILILLDLILFVDF